MYIGSTGPRGLHHLIWEVVDNSVDEAMAGYASRIEVTLRADGGVTVVDNGRGIPVDKVEKTGLSGLTTVLTTLHAGGKFSEGAYTVSGGLHAWVSRWSTPCPSAWKRRCAATATCGPRASAAGYPTRKTPRRAPRSRRPAPRSLSGPIPRSSPRVSSSTTRRCPPGCGRWLSSTVGSRSFSTTNVATTPSPRPSTTRAA